MTLNKLKQQIIDGELEIWQVHQEPVGEEQEKLSKEIEEKYNNVSIDHRLHLDDDHDEIYDIILNSW